MGGLSNQKEKLLDIIKGLGESKDSNKVEKNNIKQLQRVSVKLIQNVDECKDCQAYVNKIVQLSEDTNNFSNVQNKQETLKHYRFINAIILHLQKKHKLVTEGYFIIIYSCIGLPIGMVFGVMLRIVGIGMLIGICMGLIIGAVFDFIYRKKVI